MMTPKLTTASSGSDAAIRRALEILSGLTSTTGGGGLVTGDTRSNAGGFQSFGDMSGASANANANARSVGSGNDLPPQLEALLNLMIQRMQQQQPLFESVTNQALSGLPAYTQIRTSNLSPLVGG